MIPMLPRIFRKKGAMDGSGMYSADSGTHYRTAARVQIVKVVPNRSASHPDSLGPPPRSRYPTEVAMGVRNEGVG